MRQVFGCPCVYSTSNDETQALSKMFGGKPVEYPYIFVSISTVGANHESYATNRMARRGVPVVVSDEQVGMLRLLPTSFECEVKFVTNRFSDIDQGSVTSFSRRWLFARRCGYLKFNINYGRLNFPIGIEMTDSVPVPKLENKVEQESAYPPITVSLTVKGYMSEPELGSQGIVNTVEVDSVVLNPDGSVPGSQFFSFNRE